MVDPADLDPDAVCPDRSDAQAEPNGLYAAKALKTRPVVETAGGILLYYQGLERAGRLPGGEA